MAQSQAIAFNQLMANALAVQRTQAHSLFHLPSFMINVATHSITDIKEKSQSAAHFLIEASQSLSEQKSSANLVNVVCDVLNSSQYQKTIVMETLFENSGKIQNKNQKTEVLLLLRSECERQPDLREKITQKLVDDLAPLSEENPKFAAHVFSRLAHSGSNPLTGKNLDTCIAALPKMIDHLNHAVEMLIKLAQGNEKHRLTILENVASIFSKFEGQTQEYSRGNRSTTRHRIYNEYRAGSQPWVAQEIAGLLPELVKADKPRAVGIIKDILIQSGKRTNTNWQNTATAEFAFIHVPSDPENPIVLLCQPLPQSNSITFYGSQKTGQFETHHLDKLKNITGDFADAVKAISGRFGSDLFAYDHFADTFVNDEWDPRKIAQSCTYQAA